MILPLAVVLAVAAMAPRESAPGGRTIGPRRSSLGGGRDIFQGSLFLLLALTMAVALICSRSRMGIVSSLVSLGLVGAILTWKRRSAGFVVSVLLVVGVAILLFGQGNSGPLIDRYLGTPNELHDGFGRWALWQQAGKMALAFPLLGVGYGAFPFVFPMFRTTGAGAAVSHAHNDYLEIIVETGAVGCLLGIALVILGIRTLLYRGGIRPDFGFLGYGALAGVLAMGLHSFTDFNLAIPANALTLSALIGMMICWTRVPKPALVGVTGTVSHRSWRVWIPAGVLMAVAPVVLEPLVGTDLIAESGDLPYRASPTRLGTTFLPPDNAERIFQTAARICDAALDDFRIIQQTREIGDVPSELTVKYIRRRLDDAINLQSRGLRYQPTSSSGHVLLGHLLAAR
ncbi:MAG: O-antigen ligase family protein, partial [Acidobacteriota bacterium]